MFSTFMDRKLFFSSTGEGNPLILLHGFLENSKIWEPFLEDLSQKRQVICVDLPGHGNSQNISPVHSMELMAEAVISIVNHLGIKKAFFAGHSMGGYVALAILERSPEVVAGIMLINSTPEEDSFERKTSRDRAVKLVQKNKRAFISMSISNLLSPANKENFKCGMEEIKREAQRLNSAGIIAALLGMKIRTDRKNILRHAEISKIMIIGKNDPILNSDHLISLAKTTGCDFKILSGGHLPFIENQDQFKKIMHLVD